MQHWASILAVVGSFIILVIIPGPNFVRVVTHAVSHSRQIGIFTAMGVGTGTLIHGTAGILGVFLVVLHTPFLYDALKILGGLYLVYIGIKTWTSPPKVLDKLPAAEKAINPKQAFRAGLATNLSNPKTAAFFLSVFTSLLPPDTPLWAKVVTVSLMGLSSLTWYSIVAASFSQAKVRHVYHQLGKPIKIIVGGVFVMFGVRVATT